MPNASSGVLGAVAVVDVAMIIYVPCPIQLELICTESKTPTLCFLSMDWVYYWYYYYYYYYYYH